jgi:hypothetical protein
MILLADFGGDCFAQNARNDGSRIGLFIFDSPEKRGADSR